MTKGGPWPALCAMRGVISQVDRGAAVLRFFDAVAGLDEKFGFAFAGRRDGAVGNPLRHQVRFGGVGAAFGEALVVFRRADGVGVADD